MDSVWTNYISRKEQTAACWTMKMGKRSKSRPNMKQAGEYRQISQRITGFQMSRFANAYRRAIRFATKDSTRAYGYARHAGIWICTAHMHMDMHGMETRSSGKLSRIFIARECNSRIPLVLQFVSEKNGFPLCPYFIIGIII